MRPTRPCRAGRLRAVIRLLTSGLCCALLALGGPTAYAAPAPGDLSARPTTAPHRTPVVTRLAGWSSRSLATASGSRTVFAVRVLNRVGRAGRPILLQRREVAGGPWSLAGRATTDRTGRARLSWVAPSSATRVWLRLRAPAQGRALTLVTGPRLVAVRSGPPGDDDAQVDARVAQVLALVNVARATRRTCGEESYAAAPALHLDSRLNRAAGGYAQRMAAEDFFDHTSPEGDDPGDRITAAGYEWQAWGENIAAGQDSAADVVQDWLDSPGHCRNLMSRAFVDIGIGVAADAGSSYGTYWVQDFGHP